MENPMFFLSKHNCVNYFSIFLLAFFLPLINARISAATSTSTTRITVVFRYDDYSSLSSAEIETNVLNLFQKMKIGCTVGVVPFICAGDGHNPAPQEVIPLTVKKFEILKKLSENDLLEVALHGYSHQYTGRRHPFFSDFHGVNYTEFYGMEYSEQLARLEKGKSYLEELFQKKVTTFIPPWNSYDLNTILALEKSNFECLSAGPRGDVKKNSRIKYLPETCGIIELKNVIENLRKRRDIEPVIVVEMHPTDFSVKNNNLTIMSLAPLENILSWTKNQKDISILTIEETTKSIQDLSAERFLSNKSFRQSIFFAPPFLQVFLKGSYLSSIMSQKLSTKGWILCLTFYLTALLVISVVFFWIVQKFLRGTGRLGKAVIFELAVMAGLIYCLWQFPFGYLTALTFLFFISQGFGIIFSLIRFEGKNEEGNKTII
jgi:predicted deacetylase